MTGLALVPLDTRTLPGWPAADDPSLLHLLFVLLVIPAAITLVILAFVTVSRLAARNRATSTGVIAERPTNAPELPASGAHALTSGPREEPVAAETALTEHEAQRT